MVYIILLNWNGWKDTIHCLESIFRSEYKDFRVIVCDNLSSDGSMEKIESWAKGELIFDEKINESLEHLVLPPVPKPLPYYRYSKEEAEKEGNTDNNDHRLILIDNGSNNGFSAGNNVGVRFALQRKADFIWLLNNDTVIKNNTLGELVQHMETDRKTGAAGSVIYFASNPDEMQTFGGGRVSSFLGVDRFSHTKDAVNYIAGTSLFVRAGVFEQAGLLDEGFFFYWEDVDFSRRVENCGWKLDVVENAVVYHKFSASVGGGSLKSDLFKTASLTRYFKKHFKRNWFFPVFFNIGGMVINRFLRFQFSRIVPIIKELSRSMKQGE